MDQAPPNQPPPNTPPKQARPDPDHRAFPWPARLAGGLMLLSAAISLWGVGSGAGRPRGALGQLLLGLFLLKGSPTAVSITRVLAWLSLILGVLIGCFLNLEMGLTYALASAGTLLLLGEAPRPRNVVAGTLLVLASLGLKAAGTYYASTGTNPLSQASMAAMTDPLPADRTVRGKAAPYTYELPPNQGWALLKPAEGAKINPRMEGWAVNPTSELYVCVTAEKTPTPTFTVLDFAQTVRTGMPQARFLDQQPLGDGLVLHYKESAQGQEFERLLLLKIKGPHALQVQAWGQAQFFPKNEPTLRGILASFRL